MTSDALFVGNSMPDAADSAGRLNGSAAGAGASSTSHRSEILELQYLQDLQTEQRNHRRAEAHSDAELRRHYGDAYRGDDDEMIQWHSPTTTNNYYTAPGTPKANPPQDAPRTAVGLLAKTAIAAGLLGGGGLAGYMANAYLSTPPATTATTPGTNTTTGFIIEAGDGG